MSISICYYCRDTKDLKGQDNGRYIDLHPQLLKTKLPFPID